MPITSDNLKDELKQLDIDLAGYENKRRRRTLVAELLKCYGVDIAQPELNIPHEPDSAPFLNMGATKAIIAFLSKNPADLFTAREIATELRAGGVKSDSPNFLTTIHTNCDRKAKAGELEQGAKDGVKAYRIKLGAV